MARCRIRPAADADLDNHARHITEDNLDAALRFYDQARRTFDDLAAMPGMGIPYPSDEPRLTGLRFFPIKTFPNHLVFYRPSADGIEVIRILHSRMDKLRHL